jgi:hypothetical protein
MKAAPTAAIDFRLVPQKFRFRLGSVSDKRHYLYQASALSPTAPNH